MPDTSWVAIAVAAIIAIVIIGVVYFTRFDGRTISELTATRMRTAHSLGLQFAVRQPWTHSRMWDEGPFGSGSRRYGTDIMFGLYDGRPVVSFSHEWDLAKQFRSNVTVGHMVTGVWVGGALPLITVLRERSIPDMPGDVLTGDAPFDRAYRVISKDADAARAALSGQVGRFVLANDKNVVEFWFENGWIFTAWEPAGEAVDLAEQRYHLSFVTGLAKTLPAHLRAGDQVAGPHGSAQGPQAARVLFPRLRSARPGSKR